MRCIKRRNHFSGLVPVAKAIRNRTEPEASEASVVDSGVGILRKTTRLGASVDSMKPLTAAKKLGIFLPATPEEFRNGEISHAQFNELQSNPPEWLTELRRNGPHPRPEVARKLGITITALKKNDMDKPLTTEDIKNLLEQMPEWLAAARESLAQQRTEAAEAEAKKDEGPGKAAADAAKAAQEPVQES